MTFRFIWREEEGGSFYEQDYPNYDTFEDAFVAWHEFWCIEIIDCVVWKAELVL